MGTRGAVFSKRGPNTTGRLGSEMRHNNIGYGSKIRLAVAEGDEARQGGTDGKHDVFRQAAFAVDRPRHRTDAPAEEGADEVRRLRLEIDGQSCIDRYSDEALPLCGGPDRVAWSRQLGNDSGTTRS